MPIPELVKFREKYPDYGDMDDSTLAQKLASKYPDAYGDLPGKVEKPDDTITHEEVPVNQMDFAREQMKLTREKGQKGFQSDLVGLLKMFAQPTETGRQMGAALATPEGRAELIRPIKESIENPMGVPARLGEWSAEHPLNAALNIIPGLGAAKKVLTPFAEEIVRPLANTKLPERLMASAVKMPLSKKWTRVRGPEETSQVEKAASTAVEERIRPSEFGQAKTKTLRKAAGEEIGMEVSQTEGTASLDDIMSNGIKRAKERALAGENTANELKVIDDYSKAYVKSKNGNLTADELQKLKLELDERINWDKVSGKGDPLVDTIRKGLRHELRVSLEELNPKLKTLNKSDQGLILLDEALDRSLARSGNREIVSLGTKVLLGRESWPLAIVNMTIGHPQVKASLAFALDRARAIARGMTKSDLPSVFPKLEKGPPPEMTPFNMVTEPTPHVAPSGKPFVGESPDEIMRRITPEAPRTLPPQHLTGELPTSSQVVGPSFVGESPEAMMSRLLRDKYREPIPSQHLSPETPLSGSPVSKEDALINLAGTVNPKLAMELKKGTVTPKEAIEVLKNPPAESLPKAEPPQPTPPPKALSVEPGEVGWRKGQSIKSDETKGTIIPLGNEIDPSKINVVSGKVRQGKPFSIEDAPKLQMTPEEIAIADKKWKSVLSGLREEGERLKVEPKHKKRKK
jgi:hypothetical protein